MTAALSVIPDLELPTPEELEAEQCRRSFKRFVRRAWGEVDPAPLVWGWHIDALCEHLQAVSEGRIKKLVINIPPGHAKSMIVSVLWPAWHWIRDPSWRVMTASYEIGLAMRDAVKARELISTEWYQTHFAQDPDGYGESWQLSSDQNVKSFYTNDALGFRLCLSVGGKGTGWRGDALVIDDPLNASEAHSKVKRDEVLRWKTETMSSRFNDMANAAEVVIMQRLHEEDLSGFLLKSGEWDHLCLPSEFEVKRHCTCPSCKRGSTSIGWRDPRSKEGELLFPAKFSRAVLAAAKKPGTGMGSIAYAGQHQQRPVPAAGGLLLRPWFNYRWRHPGEAEVEGLVSRPINPRTHKWAKLILVSDLAFKKTQDSDRVACGVWGLYGPDAYLVDLVWERMSFTETLQALLDLRKKWTTNVKVKLSEIAIEDKANGSAVVDVLKKKFPGVVAFEPDGGKEARIAGTSTYWEAGNVWLPQEADWVADYIAEALAFPRAAHDDAIDMTASALGRLLTNNRSGFLQRMTKG